MLGSFFAWQASLQERIYQNFKGDKFIQAFYNGYINPAPDEFHPGTVLEMNYDGFVLEQGDKTTINVKISKTTQTPQGFKIYKGGRLLVIGKIEDGVIDAEAIDNAPLSGRP